MIRTVALGAPYKEVLPRFEGTKVCDEAESLAASRPTKLLGSMGSCRRN